MVNDNKMWPIIRVYGQFTVATEVPAMFKWRSKFSAQGLVKLFSDSKQRLGLTVASKCNLFINSH